MREGSLYCIQCLVPDTVIPLYPYNHSQQLEVGADGASTYPEGPSQGEENDYKRGVRETKGGGGNPQHTKGTRKSTSDLAEDQVYLVNLVYEEHRDGRSPYTKAQLFDPLSTNSLYWAR